jgi:hypothetical protein
MTKTIEIIVTPEGRTSVQTIGFAGSSCRDASRFIEEALGRRLNERLTPEFHQAESASHVQSRQA